MKICRVPKTSWFYSKTRNVLWIHRTWKLKRSARIKPLKKTVTQGWDQKLDQRVGKEQSLTSSEETEGQMSYE